MGAGHSHAPATGHAGGRYRRRLAGAFALTAGVAPESTTEAVDKMRSVGVDVA